MPKTLKDFLEVYKPKSPDEQKFVDKHVVIKHKDRNGNGDDVFNGNTKTIKRKEERHGYDVGEDEKVYEDVDIDAVLDEALDLLMSIDEKTLTPAEMKKREEVVKAIKRDDPKMDKSMAYAIATKTAKRVAEGTMPTADEPTDANKKTAQRIRDLLAKEKKPVKEEAEDIDEIFASDYSGMVGKFKKSVEAAEDAHKTGNADKREQHLTNARNRLMGMPSKDTAKLKNSDHYDRYKKLRDMKEAVEELDEKDAYNEKNPGRYGGPASKEKEKTVSAFNRVKIGRKPNAYYKEEAEEIEELSRAALTRYTQKAGRDISKLGSKKVDAMMSGDNQKAAALIKKQQSRTDMQALARNKMNPKVRVHATEEVEQVDEISKATMGRYINKAKDSIDMTSYRSGIKDGTAISSSTPYKSNNPLEKKLSKRHKGIETAVKKLTKEEAEDLDESAKIAAHLIKRYGDNVRKSHVVSAANDFGVDASKLAKAVRTKLGKTSLAEEEQIDELSSKTLFSYGKKARKEADKLDDPMHRARGRLLASKKTNPARGGYKLTKVAATFGEEAEDLDELSKGTVNTYFDKALDSGVKATQVQYKKGASSAEVKAANAVAAKRGRGLKMASKKMTQEEVEAIDELSKKTLGSYVKQAADQKDKLKQDAVTTSKLGHDMRKLDNNEAGAQKMFQRAGKQVHKAANRQTGLNRAVDKLTREEVEAIDELSKKTLGSYTYQAASQLGSRGITTGLKIAADEPTEKNFKKMGNRQKGVATAVKKLTKEDVINRTIEKYVPEELKFTPEERLLKRLDGLSEAHVNTLLGLFEALNKDNQNKMIETVETREGINQILNFVLDNRGE